MVGEPRQLRRRQRITVNLRAVYSLWMSIAQGAFIKGGPQP